MTELTTDLDTILNPISEKDHKMHFMREHYHMNLAERENWNDALISYEEYYQQNNEWLEEEWKIQSVNPCETP